LSTTSSAGLDRESWLLVCAGPVPYVPGPATSYRRVPDNLVPALRSNVAAAGQNTSSPAETLGRRRVSRLARAARRELFRRRPSPRPAFARLRASAQPRLTANAGGAAREARTVFASALPVPALPLADFRFARLRAAVAAAAAATKRRRWRGGGKRDLFPVNGGYVSVDR